MNWKRNACENIVWKRGNASDQNFLLLTLPKDKILNLSKFKQIADKILKCI